MADGKVILVSGISGSGSREFCRRYDSHRIESGVKVHNTGMMMRERAGTRLDRYIPRENFPNLHSDTLSLLEYGVFDEIRRNLPQDKQSYGRIIIDTHAMLLWNQVYRNSLKDKHLEGINPDIFINIIDKPSAVRNRQLETEQGRSQKHDLRDILLWMQQEVIATQRIAENYKSPHYIFSNKQNPESVESLLMNRFLIYSSFPMTDADAETTMKIVEFKKNLRNLGRDVLGLGLETPVIDPADIDIESDVGLSPEEKDAIKWHTIHRDLKYDVGKATHVIAYYPNARTDLSMGVGHECIEGINTGKHVYLITPRVNRSPFLEKNAKIYFPTAEEFLAFFRTKFKEDWENLKR
ncbi:MAG: AAA family ATPase [archaeon]